MMNDIKKTFHMIGFHGSILAKGFIKMLYGALMATLVAVAIYGFTMIPTEGGYVAVCDFLLSICTMFVAIGGIYLMGGNAKKGAKK